MVRALTTLHRRNGRETQEIELGLSGTFAVCEDILKQKFFAADCPGYLIKLPERVYKLIKEIEDTQKETWKDYANGADGVTVDVDAGVVTCKVILHDEKRAKELKRGDRNFTLQATKITLERIKPLRKPGECLTLKLYDQKKKYMLVLDFLGIVK